MNMKEKVVLKINGTKKMYKKNEKIQVRRQEDLSQGRTFQQIKRENLNKISKQKLNKLSRF